MDVHDLEIARAEKLGQLLAMVDTVIMASENPTVFDLLEKVERMRGARRRYDEADKAYRDGRLAVKP